jgi:hypothetical protein
VGPMNEVVTVYVFWCVCREHPQAGEQVQWQAFLERLFSRLPVGIMSLPASMKEFDSKRFCASDTTPSLLQVLPRQSPKRPAGLLQGQRRLRSFAQCGQRDCGHDGRPHLRSTTCLRFSEFFAEEAAWMNPSEDPTLYLLRRQRHQAPAARDRQRRWVRQHPRGQLPWCEPGGPCVRLRTAERDSSNRSATEPFDPHCVTPTDPGLICFVSPCVCSYAYPGDITVQIRATDATTGADRRSIIQSVAWSISQNRQDPCWSPRAAR